ncbi:MAG: amidohydrolase [Candidatus Neomarinimicrobiota bacterium]
MVKIVSLLMIFIFSCSKDRIQKIYYNGIVWTGDDITPMVSAIAVTDEFIIAVGGDEEILSMADQKTDKIDLLGRFVSPGFIDNHVHFISGGLQLSRVNLSDATTKEIFQERLVNFDKILPNESWILGGNWDHELWGGQYPDKSWIDEVINDRPVLIDRLDGHMSLANSKALDIAGINSYTMDPMGGIILKGENNEPTGILKELAINLVSELVPELSIDELDKALDIAMDYALSLGITQIHDMGSWRDLETYKRNHDQGKLKIRIKIYPWYTDWKKIIKYVNKNGYGDDWLRWDGIKGMMDGSLGSRTAWMSKPYLSDPLSKEKEIVSTLGIITVEDTLDFKRILRETDKADIQHAVHAIGDRANDWILDEYAKIKKELGIKDRRPRIEHSQHLSVSALNRFAIEEIIPSMQPYHLYDDGCWAHKRIGNDILSRTYVFKTLIETGANLTFGSDWTVASLNPMTGIYASITRKTRDGKNPNGWFPEEKINVQDALKSYTINNSYAAFWEEKTGSIVAGKYADFIVHSENLLEAEPEKILHSKVVRTVVGGRDFLYE